MSAVCGVVFEDSRPDAGRVAGAMLARMTRRAAHGAQVWSGEAAGLASATMRAGQPAALAVRGPLVVVADARLDNAAELAALLGEPADAPAALVAAAFERWGRDAPARLRGDFAVAVLDADARTAVLVRDRFGVRPLHYACVPGRAFAFASTLDGLFAVPGLERRLDEWQLGAHLADVFDDPGRTIYAGALKVPQSATAHYARGAVSVSTYYTLGPEPGRVRTPADWVEGFHDRFVEAVRVRLVGASRVGSQLSGGLDSTAVTAVARDVLPAAQAPLHTYSLVYPSAPEADESPYIDAVVAQGGVEAHKVRGDDITPLSNLHDVYHVVDDIIVAGNQHSLWLLFEQARADGVDVLLDGLDGDHAVEHGYAFLEDLARAGRWGRFRTEAHALVQRFGSPDHAQAFETDAHSVDRLFGRYGYPVLAEHARSGRFLQAARGAEGAHRALGASRRTLAHALVRAAVRRSPPPGLPEMSERMLGALDPAFVARTSLRERLVEHGRERAPESMRERQAGDLLNDRMALALSGLDQVAASFGIELRHPFMDQALLEYALSLPPELSLHDGWTRYILREAVGPYMPLSVRQRIGKADASGVLGRAFATTDRARVAGALDAPGVLGPYLNLDAVGVLRAEADRSTVATHDTARVAATLLATASVWLDTKFERA